MIFYETGAKLADILLINFAKPSFVVIQSFAKSLLVWWSPACRLYDRKLAEIDPLAASIILTPCHPGWEPSLRMFPENLVEILLVYSWPWMTDLSFSWVLTFVRGIKIIKTNRFQKTIQWHIHTYMTHVKKQIFWNWHLHLQIYSSYKIGKLGLLANSKSSSHSS